jgi:hypothetical protein
MLKHLVAVLGVAVGLSSVAFAQQTAPPAKHHKGAPAHVQAPVAAAPCVTGWTFANGACMTPAQVATVNNARLRADCIVQIGMNVNHCPAILPNPGNGLSGDMTLPRGADVKAYDFRPGQPSGIFEPGLSDIRLKFDITQLAQLDNGIKLYRFRYIWSDQVYVGVMAQQVAAIVPEAVRMDPDGYLRVNYDRLGLKMLTLQEWQAQKSVISNP